ncbi:hypothetical protein MMC29_002389 [Sticta canariensis]|nr:hypothetical protein [Sticta canariensis]
MAAPNPQKQFSLAIVGGGIGGLYLANSLVCQNIHVHVYEASPAFSEIGAGVGLSPNALTPIALQDSAILGGFNRCVTTKASSSECGRFFIFRYGMKKPSADGMVEGQKICEVRQSSETSSVHRARFLKELVRLMPEGAASFSKRLVGIEDKGEEVLLNFSDGTEARHDAVVGCDGIKSQVRKLLLGEGIGGARQSSQGDIAIAGLCQRIKL